MNKRKIQVVNHALALFIEKGILQTSIQDIIERSGISKGTFYNYFSSKNECVSAVIEQIRYEISMKRSELQVGKDINDLNVLIEQISIISLIHLEYGLSTIFEEILYSHDKEMKKYILNFRILETEWLAERLIDVYGEQLRKHAFEAAVIYYGIQHYLNFTAKFMNQNLEPKTISSSIFQYMDGIINNLVEKNTAVFDHEKLNVLKYQINTEKVEREQIVELIDEIVSSHHLTKKQDELTAALRYEIMQDPVREFVINALLQPFLESYQGSHVYSQAREISNMAWRYMKQ